MTPRPIQVGIDALFVRPRNHAGGEVALLNLLRSLRRHGDGMEFVIFAQARSVSAFPAAPGFRVVPVPIPRGGLNKAARFAWQNTFLRVAARRHQLDVTLFPANLVPALFPTRTLLITHDFSSLFYRERLPEIRLPFSKRVLDYERVRSCRRANALLTISEFSASEIARITGVDRDRIQVVPWGVRQFRVPSDGEARATVGRYGVRRPFLLAVASMTPHKNLPRLVAAFARCADAELAPFDLVLAGQAGRDRGAIRAAIGQHGLHDRVVLPGFIPDGDLPAFYRAADIFVLPSLYEGFGLPVLEAGLCGTAVAAGRAGSLPEVVGDAGLLFDPWDVEDIAATLRRLALSRALREELGNKGRARAGEFSWDRAAELIATSLREAAPVQTTHKPDK